MTNYAVESVDEYILSAPKEARSHLQQVRTAVKAAAPNSNEALKWGKPYYSHKGMLAGFDALKNHISFEIWTDELKLNDRELLEKAGYKTAKRTFQIQYDQPVPVELIKKLIKAQVKINEAKENISPVT